jgi:hypothetical protein
MQNVVRKNSNEVSGRLEGNIKLYLSEIGFEDVGCIQLNEDRVQQLTVLNVSVL